MTILDINNNSFYNKFDYNVEKAIEALKKEFGQQFSISKSVREQHTSTTTVHTPELPDGVVFAYSKDDVQKTVNKCREYPNLSRFRIRADNYISQTDARRLQKILTKQKAASEVVFKVDSKFDSDKIETSKSGGLTIDLRSPEKHKELLREYYKSNNL